ncbi:MAG: hypothetical protein WAM71_14460, partial [Candidatus Korobacteraceae bacterium]
NHTHPALRPKEGLSAGLSHFVPQGGTGLFAFTGLDGTARHLVGFRQFDESAREIREYFIPDFSNWKDHDSYQKAFSKLVADLKAQSG